MSKTEQIRICSRHSQTLERRRAAHCAPRMEARPGPCHQPACLVDSFAIPTYARRPATHRYFISLPGRISALPSCFAPLMAASRGNPPVGRETVCLQIWFAIRQTIKSFISACRPKVRRWRARQTEVLASHHSPTASRALPLRATWPLPALSGCYWQVHRAATLARCRQHQHLHLHRPLHLQQRPVPRLHRR